MFHKKGNVWMKLCQTDSLHIPIASRPASWQHKSHIKLAGCYIGAVCYIGAMNVNFRKTFSDLDMLPKMYRKAAKDNACL